jgi:hypothetical protein
MRNASKIKVEKDHLGDLSVNRGVRLNGILTKWLGRMDVDWLNLARGKIHWWIFVNTAMNFRVP